MVIKIPIFIFHVWLGEAHVEASTEGSVLLAGLLLKLGTYGLWKYNIEVLGVFKNLYLIELICVIGVVYV